MKVVVTGCQGFIGSHLCDELLSNGYSVMGLDDCSRYGKIERKHDNHPEFTFLETNIIKCQITPRLGPCFKDIDVWVSAASEVYGTRYYDKRSYDVLQANARILTTETELAIKLFKEYQVKRQVVLSGSEVFENAETFPTTETSLKNILAPVSTYGFQTLLREYITKSAYEQHQLPYTIIRPSNCVGTGIHHATGKVNKSVLPDLINKTLQGQDPLHILGSGNQVRCFTDVKDVVRGIRLAIESEAAINEDFNISTSQTTTILELAQLVWKEINGDKPFNYISDEPPTYDIQKRIPDVTKAKEILGFEATIPLHDSIKQVITYINKLDKNK